MCCRHELLLLNWKLSLQLFFLFPDALYQILQRNVEQYCCGTGTFKLKIVSLAEGNVLRRKGKSVEVVTALAYHQCDLGHDIRGSSFVVESRLCFDIFFSWTSLEILVRWRLRSRWRTTMRYATFKSLHIYLPVCFFVFLYLCIYLFIIFPMDL